MDVIKKTINIEGFITRVPAIIPYYDINGGTTPILPDDENTAYGNVLGDYWGYTESTLSLLKKYYRLNEIERGGIKLKKVTTPEGECYTDIFTDTVKASNFKVYNLAYFEIINEHLYKETTDHSVTSSEYISLVSDEEYKEYQAKNTYKTKVTPGEGTPTTMSLKKLVEDEIIGLVEVPVGITGELVPEKFYLANVKLWIDWFNTHRNADDCCLEDEWNKRGGDAMLSFLIGLQTTVKAKRNMWQSRLNGVNPPEMHVPVLLTQNYDDMGAMSVIDDEASFKTNQAGVHERIEFENDLSAVVESRLKALRSRTVEYDRETGEPLPYIGNGHVPYRVGEWFNEAYDSEKNEYYADYIKSIAYYAEDGMEVAGEWLDDEGEINTTGDTSAAAYATFEYVQGGEYNPTVTRRLKLEIDEVAYGYNYQGYIQIRVTADTEWMIVTTENCEVTEQTSGSPITVKFIGVNESTTENRVAKLAIATTDGDYEEASVSFYQKPAPYRPSCSIYADNIDTIRLGSAKTKVDIKVTSTNSGWYVSSKPDFVTIIPKQNYNSGRTSVTLYVDELTGDFIRLGQITFTCINDEKVKTTVSVIQRRVL